MYDLLADTRPKKTKEKVKNKIDRSNHACGIFVDFQKAFEAKQTNIYF